MIIRLSADGTNHESYVVGDCYRHAESARVLARAGFAIDDDVSLRSYADAEAGHCFTVNTKHLVRGKPVIEISQVKQVHRVRALGRVDAESKIPSQGLVKSCDV